MYRLWDKTDTHCVPVVGQDRHSPCTGSGTRQTRTVYWLWDKTDTHCVLVLSTGPKVSAHEEDTGAGVEVEEVGGVGARDGVAVDLVHGSVLGKHNHISTTSLPHLVELSVGWPLRTQPSPCCRPVHCLTPAQQDQVSARKTPSFVPDFDLALHAIKSLASFRVSCCQEKRKSKTFNCVR